MNKINPHAWTKNSILSQKHRNTFYKSYAWQKCRGIILERDDYLCQICLKQGEPIPADTVHHIIHLKDDPSRALNENNLISVCFDCHNDLHPEKGFGQTIEQRISNKIKVFKVNKNPENGW